MQINNKPKEHDRSLTNTFFRQYLVHLKGKALQMKSRYLLYRIYFCIPVHDVILVLKYGMIQNLRKYLKRNISLKVYLGWINSCFN